MASTPKTVVFNVRIGSPIIKRADTLAKKIRGPGEMKLTRSDIIRMAIDIGLEQLERREG